MSAEVNRTRPPFVLDEAMLLLERTPAALDALLRGLPDSWIEGNEGGTTWSAFDVVGHLIHADRTNWLPRMAAILEHGESRPFDDFDRFAQLTQSQGRTMAALLEEFAAIRQQSLRELTARALSDADLDRRGRHPALGMVTLRQLLSTWVSHDLDHLMQVSRVLARQYSDEVGPWRAFLRIIRDAPA